jgi:hypothetical protein
VWPERSLCSEVLWWSKEVPGEHGRVVVLSGDDAMPAKPPLHGGDCIWREDCIWRDECGRGDPTTPDAGHG